MSVVLIVSFPVFVACDRIRESGNEVYTGPYSSQTPVNLNLDHFPLNQLSFFFYSDTNTPPEGLGQSFGFGHRERENFACSDRCKGNI